jgi:hypothetical protein
VLYKRHRFGGAFDFLDGKPAENNKKSGNREISVVNSEEMLYTKLVMNLN